MSKISNIFDIRKVKRIVARYTSLRAIPVLRITITSMFFSTRISHVINELKQRKELREFLGIGEKEVSKESYIYTFLSKFSLNEFINIILRILNSITK